MGALDAAGRRQILAIQTQDMPLDEKATAALDEVAVTSTPGYTGADLQHLVREAGLAAVRRVFGSHSTAGISSDQLSSGFSVEAGDIYAGLQRVQPSAIRGLFQDRFDVAWDQVAVERQTKQDLLSATRSALTQTGAEWNGVLLSGPSGVGKSLLVSTLAERLQVNLVPVNGAAIFSQWLGESEATLRSLFDKAMAAAPSILALDHLDAIAPMREINPSSHAGRRVLATLLSCLDRVGQTGGVAVIGMTDRPDLVEAAALRRGRLGHHVRVSE